MKRELDTDHIHLLFNNAGIGGGGSIVNGDRAQWEKTFNVCWGGVYYGTRVFLPMMMNAREAHIVNTSSVNGFWASIGPGRPHTAYCAAKFAVKGFTEALMTDLAVNAPHIKCSVVMPGHIGTEIVANSRKILSGSETAIDVPAVRKALAAQGTDISGMSDDQVRAMVDAQAAAFRDNAPTTAARGREDHPRRRAGGEVAHPRRQGRGLSRRRVRAAPEEAYSPPFYEALVKGTEWRI